MRIAVIGAGSFGTTIAQLFSKKSDEVLLFGRNEPAIKSINDVHVNTIYHPLIKLNDNIKAVSLFTESAELYDSDLVAFCVPSGSVREVARYLSRYLSGKPILSTAKGMEYPSLKLPTEVISDETGNDHVFSISGPTFSSEMINGALSSVTLGLDKPECMRLLMNMLQAPNMLVDLSADVVGVELCGVLKNVYAVAMGIVDSNFYTYNEHYALLNLCFKEMVYILDAAGHGNLSEKFCAFGDFNLTANADKSRNRTLGLMIGKNISLNSAQSTVTFESIKSAKAIKEYSRGFSLNTPIVDFVNSAFNEPKDIRIQISRLINNIQNKIDYNCY